MVITLGVKNAEKIKNKRSQLNTTLIVNLIFIKKECDYK